MKRAIASRSMAGLTAFAAAGGLFAAGAAHADTPDYEIWAFDQGTHKLHIYSSDLKSVERVDLGAHGIRTPHMVDFTSDHAYAFVASTGSGDVAVIRTEDREVIDILDTGPRSHMAGVAPDDSRVLVDVIGSPDDYRDGAIVEITVDLDNEEFEIGRTLTVADDPLFQEYEDRFADAAPICHEYAGDGQHAYITLGPGLDDGGLVVLDVDSFSLEAAFPPDTLTVNCGTMPINDGQHMVVNGGGPETGVWYVLDTETIEVVHEDDSRGYDAHGVWATPDGDELWMVNRVSDDGIVIDTETFEIIDELDFVGETPDILSISPDGRFAYISLRGPEPVSAPHVAVGSTPGFSVMDVETRELISVVQPDSASPESDFHAIGLRLLHD